MLNRVRTFFQPPVFPEDEDKSRKASYAHTIALAFTGVVLAYELFLRFTRPFQAFDQADIILFTLAVVGMISWRFIRQGHVTATSIILIILIWAGANGIAASGYGIRDSSFIINFVIILIAALLLGWQAAALTAAASIIAAFGLAYGETFGWIITTQYPVTSFAQDISVVLGLGAFFIYIIITGLENAVQRSRNNQRKLEAANRELEQAQTELRAQTAQLAETNAVLQKRTERLRTVAEVARAAAAVQNIDQLLPLLSNIISQQLGYYHIGIFLLDASKQYAILRSANTEGGLKIMERGDRLKVGGQDVIGFVSQSGKPQIAIVNMANDETFFGQAHLPDTRAELVLPLKISGEIIGVLDLHSREPNAFNEEDIPPLTILADQVAVAIQNVRSVEQAQRALHEAEVASSQLTGQAWKGYYETIRAKGYRYDGIKPEPLKKTITNGEETDTFTVPVQLRGQTLGRLKLKTSGMTRKWTDDELAIIEATAERVALAMDGARLLEDAQKRATREAFLSELAAKLGASFQLDSILRDTVEELGQTLKGSTVTFQLVNPSAYPAAGNENSGPADRMKSE